MKNKRNIYLLIFLMLFGFTDAVLFSQEKEKILVIPVELGQGFRRGSNSPPEIYLASLSTKPSFVLIKNNLRVGATGMIVYNNGNMDLFGGPRVTMKVFESAIILGGIFNIQLGAEALWGTRNKKLFGGSIIIDADVVCASINGWQEYYNKELWIDISVGLSFNIWKKNKDPFE